MPDLTTVKVELKQELKAEMKEAHIQRRIKQQVAKQLEAAKQRAREELLNEQRAIKNEKKRARVEKAQQEKTAALDNAADIHQKACEDAKRLRKYREELAENPDTKAFDRKYGL